MAVPVLARALVSVAMWGSASAVEIEWHAPPGCPDAARVRARIEARLAGTVGAAPSAVLTVVRTETGFALEAVVDAAGGRSTRRLEAATCDELVEAAALLVSLAVSAEPVAPTDDAATEPMVPVAPDTAPAVPEPAAPSAPSAPSRANPEPPARAGLRELDVRIPPDPAGTERRRPHGVLAALGGLGLGALPAPTATLALTAGLGGRRWEAPVGLSYWVVRESALPQGARGRFQLVFVDLRGCGVPRVGRVDLPLCGGVLAGAVLAEGTEGVVQPRRAVHPWIGLEADVAARVWLTRRWAVVVRATGSLALARPRFEVTGLGPVCCGAGGLAAAVGVTARLGPPARNGSSASRTIPGHAAPRALPP